ncbi:hypothetical protein GRF29_77g749897 [Pseudopithomyces chartarum]|uniref:Uncharacterized protein n=1 Tax=Pseudopithomyces chartarum TaxID=1892770 RepID=A0AAN6LVX6_9PLEO|nr:hypothetical protein GRF29_77g749897 [Pseudopithomyces chartarum]
MPIPGIPSPSDPPDPNSLSDALSPSNSPPGKATSPPSPRSSPPAVTPTSPPRLVRQNRAPSRFSPRPPPRR